MKRSNERITKEVSYISDNGTVQLVYMKVTPGGSQFSLRLKTAHEESPHDVYAMDEEQVGELVEMLTSALLDQHRVGCDVPNETSG